MKYRVVIIDDEEPARMLLTNYVEQTPMLELIGTCKGVFEAEQFLSKNVVDILLVDIKMGQLSGFDLLKSLKQRPVAIITSAYSEYALEGFEFGVADYMLKPISFNRFYEGIKKAITLVKAKNVDNQPKEEINDNYMFFKIEHKFVKIFFDKICHFESFGEYVKIHLQDGGRLVTLTTMANLENTLPQNLFFRVHRTFIVNISQITEIEGYTITINNRRLPISRNRKDELFAKVNFLK